MWKRKSKKNTLKKIVIVNGNKIHRDEDYQAWLSQQNSQQLVEEYDRVFSLYIRQSGADSNGICQCVTCGRSYHWRDIQCGHFWSRRHKSVRWEEKNVGPQCYGCNIKNQGAAQAFSSYLVKKFGAHILELLELKKNSIWKAGKFEMMLLINECIEKIKLIKGEIK